MFSKIFFDYQAPILICTQNDKIISQKDIACMHEKLEDGVSYLRTEYSFLVQWEGVNVQITAKKSC